MIVTVCADKGAPGVSWASVALAMVWPGERVLVEADVSGGDAALRLTTADGALLPRQPTIRSLCVDARSGIVPSLSPYCVQTSLSFPVIPATDMGSDAFRLIARQWPTVASSLQQWHGTAVVDVGRLQEETASGSLAAASEVVLLVGRPTPEGLHQLGERAHALTTRLREGRRDGAPVAIVLVCPAREKAAGLRALRDRLAADPLTANVRVAGSIAFDPLAVELLRRGTVTKKLGSSELLKSAGEVVNTLLTSWPQLRVTATRPPAEAFVARGSAPVERPSAPALWGPIDAVDLSNAREATSDGSTAAGNSPMSAGGWQ